MEDEDALTAAAVDDADMEEEFVGAAAAAPPPPPPPGHLAQRPPCEVLMRISGAAAGLLGHGLGFNAAFNSVVEGPFTSPAAVC